MNCVILHSGGLKLADTVISINLRIFRRANNYANEPETTGNSRNRKHLRVV